MVGLDGREIIFRNNIFSSILATRVWFLTFAIFAFLIHSQIQSEGLMGSRRGSNAIK